MQKYGLLGHPLGHSFSRKFHNERFARLGIDAEYVNFDLDDISLLPQVLQSEPMLCGINVTIPYKQQVMQYIDELDPLAARIGAVNTVSIIRDAQRQGHVPGLWLKGYNTDIVGFSDSIRPLLVEAGIIDAATGRAHDTQAAALVLGTGGGSKAIRVALEDMGIDVLLVSRSQGPGRVTYAELDAQLLSSHRVIVNCSPVGMFPNVDACPDLPYQYITPGHVCYDLIYNPAETLFLAKARQQGARTMSGGAMLEGQAIAAYDRWTGDR